MITKKITTLFLDIGGVLLTNGWDHTVRDAAIKKFHLANQEFDPLHKKYYDLLEQGKITLDEYLNETIFWKERNFSKSDFIQFMNEQSKPYPEMLQFIRELKKKHHLTVVAVSNEGRELAEYRIKAFQLNDIFDITIVSAFVYFQKPDPHIYQMALDISQAKIDEIIYIDDRDYLVEAAAELGFYGIVHTSMESTREELKKYNL